MRLFLIIFSIVLLSASSVTLAPIIVKAKKEPSIPKWQFVENLNTNNNTTPGFDEQELKNIPGLTSITNGNQGQLTTIKVQGADSKYTKILWSGLGINETETDATLIPFSSGRIEVIKGIHCAEYGSGAIGGIVNVIPFSMPENQSGGASVNAGNLLQHSHLWWKEQANGFSIQQHFEVDSFHGKNTIPKGYQDQYPTTKNPKTEKQFFLNKFGFESHHGKTALQLGLLKSGSTGSNIDYPKPYDSRSKRTLQIYALDFEAAPDAIQPYTKVLATKIQNQDFSPYQNSPPA